MKTCSLARFDGGIKDPRDTALNGCTSSRHFILGKTKLTPYRDMETETINGGTISANKLTDVVKGTVANGGSTVSGIFGLGQIGASDTGAKFYIKATSAASSTFNALGNGEGTGLGRVIPNSLIIYKSNLYCLVDDSTNVKLIKHVYGASTTSVGNVGTSPTFSIQMPFKMFIHPKDNNLYIAAGNTAAVYTGTGSPTTRDFSTEHNITTICPYGNNIELGMVSKDETHSVVGVWSGSTASSELVDVVTWGNDCLMVLENIGDTVIGISAISLGGASDDTTLGTRSDIVIREYSGGTPRHVHTIESPQGSRLYALKGKKGDAVYFALDAYLNGTRTYQVWKIHKNELGQVVVVPDRKVNNNTELTSETMTGLSVVGDYMWVSFTDGSMRTNNDANYTATSSYETLVNPGMDAGDRSKKKKLKAVSLRCGSPTASSHTVTLSYSADGAAYRTIYTGASSAEVRVIEETAESDGKHFVEAREYMFKVETTGNGEVYELKYGYDVEPTNI